MHVEKELNCTSVFLMMYSSVRGYGGEGLALDSSRLGCRRNQESRLCRIMRFKLRDSFETHLWRPEVCRVAADKCWPIS
jgi:hypothetical protein